ncbi:MAG: hypothetical protein NC915_02125 [Candidatus Omnitrophica bacterium]|nr:hypothetical protein [Candidatus Omnitrophota bacterium]
MEEKRTRKNIISRKEKKDKLVEFIKRKREERAKKLKLKRSIPQIKHPQTYEERKSVKPQEVNKAFKLNSKRKKERREKLLALVAKKREERKKKKLLILEKKEKQKEEIKRIKEEAERKRQEELKKREEEVKRRKEEEESKRREREELHRKAEQERLLRIEKAKKDRESRRQVLINLLKARVEEQEKLRQKAILEKEERERVRQEEIKRIKEEAERKRQEEIKKREEEAKRRKEEEESKRREREELHRKAEQERLLRIEKAKKDRESRREVLIQFLRQKELANHIKREKGVLLSSIATDRKQREKEKKIELSKIKEEILKKEKETLLKKAQEEKKINTYLSGLKKTISEISSEPKQQITSSIKNISSFIIVSKKKIPKKIPIEVVEKVERPKVIPAKRPKAVTYKEPFQLNVFLRRNIFKFVFLILLLLWLSEFFMYMRKLVTPEERLKMIIGEIDIKKEEKKPSSESFAKEELVYYTKEKIDIEGKRDPFSTGRLTMEVMRKPIPTNIIFAKKPEVISIMKPPKFISILKPEEKISKPEPLTAPKIASIEKPTPLTTTEVTVSPKLPEIPKVQKVEPLPFVLLQKECPLIYRGRMILEGVEYFFIEGEKRTYRVTIGDTVEGYKILKRENSKLYLSKEGLIYEISAQ